MIAASRIAPVDCHISRCGYTGEDGFEISVADDKAVGLAELLLAQEGVQPIGLGARDSLRLEAGLCLYGHDIDETTSPIEADLAWSIQKRRRSEGGFPGAKRIQDELANGPKRRRVGIKPEGRAPAREGAEVLAMLGDRHEPVPVFDGDGVAHGLVDLVHQRLLVLRRLALVDSDAGDRHFVPSC